MLRGVVVCKRVDGEERIIYRPNAVIDLTEGHWTVRASRALTVCCSGSVVVEIYGETDVDLVLHARGDAIVFAHRFGRVTVGTEGAAKAFVDYARDVGATAQNFSWVTATNVRTAKITALDRARGRAVLGGHCP